MRAAKRRGSSTHTSPPPANPASSIAGGTRVVFPAPGGASTTRFGASRKEARMSGMSASIGSGSMKR